MAVSLIYIILAHLHDGEVTNDAKIRQTGFKFHFFISYSNFIITYLHKTLVIANLHVTTAFRCEDCISAFISK